MKAMISFIVTFPLLSVAIATSPYPNSTASDLEPVHFRLKSESAARILDKDPAFSTGYDYKVAKILSNEMLRIYLNRQLQLLDRKMQISKNALSTHNLKFA